MSTTSRGFRPFGLLVGTFDELRAAGCIQTGCDTDADKYDEASWRLLFDALMTETRRNPCDGCPVWHKGQCKAYVQFNTRMIRAATEARERLAGATEAPGTAQFPSLSVKQIADKLNISKSEVRRRKLHGEL